MESSTLTRTYEKGNGMMKPSQLFIAAMRANGLRTVILPPLP